MSSTTTPNDTPNATPIQPLHNPSQAAHIVLPQAPLGNVANHAPGMGAKALLAKRFPKDKNPAYVSPTDSLMTPCSKKLSAAKNNHFMKRGAKPMDPLLSRQEEYSDHDEMTVPKANILSDVAKMDLDDDNPF